MCSFSNRWSIQSMYILAPAKQNLHEKQNFQCKPGPGYFFISLKFNIIHKIILNTAGNLCIISILLEMKKTSTSKEISCQHIYHVQQKVDASQVFWCGAQCRWEKVVSSQKRGDKKGRLCSRRLRGGISQDMWNKPSRNAGAFFCILFAHFLRKIAENWLMNLCLLEKGNITRYVKGSYGCQQQWILAKSYKLK